MTNKEQFIHEQEHFHISNFLVDQLGYSDDEVHMFWSNIGGLVDIDLQKRKYVNLGKYGIGLR